MFAITPSFLAVIAAGLISLASAGSSDTPGRTGDAQDIQAEIDALRLRVDELSRVQGDWLTQQRASEIRALVQDVLADADTRASLLLSGMRAGWDVSRGGFKIASADGKYLLQLGGRLQVLYVYNHQRSPPASPAPPLVSTAAADRHRSGFEMRRTRLAFTGHVVDPSWQYHIQGDFSRSTGRFTLLLAYIDKQFDNGLMLRIGQFRSRFLAENHMSSARLLAVDRSLVDFTFGQTFTQGVEVHVPLGERVRLTGALHDGIPTTTGFMGSSMNTPALARTTEYALLGRAEVLLAGNWRQFREFTSWADDDVALMIGAAGAWQRDEYGTPGSVTEMIRWTVDATAKFGGANMFFAFIGNHESTKAGTGGGGAPGMSADQFGLVVQGGFFIVPDRWELFARYEWGTFDAPSGGSGGGAMGGGVADLSVITAGITRYFARHTIKWTTDIGYGFNPVATEWAAGSAGWRADAPGESGQIVVRSLLQLAF